MKKIFIPKFERPIRIPKDIKIEIANPCFAIAGEYGEWELKFSISKKIKKGDIIKFQISGGRNNKGIFQNPQIKNPEKEGYITAYFKGKKIPLLETNEKQTFILKINQEIGKGDKIKIILGDRSEGNPGIKAPKNRLLNKFFLLYKGEFTLPNHPGGGFALNIENMRKIIGVCIMHILGGEIDHLKSYVPSYVKPGKDFYILIRPEDKYNNLSFRKISGIKVFNEENEIKGKIKKIPNTTCIKFKTSIEEEGVYRLKIKDNKGNISYTNPIIVSKDNYLNLYWGMIHGHTENSDGHGKINYYFHQIKNECGLNFGAPGDHDHLWEITDKMWEKICKTTKKWNKEGEFITFLGYEWAKWRQNGDGDRNVYYFYDDRPMYRSDDTEFPKPKDLFRALKHEKAIIIPHHTGHRGNWCDFKDHNRKKERLIEIFQLRGSYEFYEKKKNPCPEKETEFGNPVEVGFINNALKMGWKVGFTAGGDDHIGQAGTEYVFEKYKQGLFGVFAKDLTREKIWKGLWERKTIATTGARIILFYKINGFFMGSELFLSKNQFLKKSRKFYIEFHGTCFLKNIDIIRNGEILKTFKKEALDFSIEWEDKAPVEKTFLPPSKFSKFPFTYYYVRAIQKDGEVAWGSPVWIINH